MSLDVDSEKRRMYMKPPPPVPPRPPKPLIERALAKTRLQHDSSPPMPTTKPPSPPKPTIAERRLHLNNNSRPVVYQSANCKKAPPPPQRTPPKEINNNKEDLENSINSSSESLDRLKIDDVESSKVQVQSDICDEFDCMFDNKNHVNTLIDEMFASVLEVSSATPSPVTEIIINDNDSTTVTTYCSSIESMSNISESENLTVISVNDDKGKINDQKNHEFLINELQNMKVLKRQRLPSKSPTRDESIPFPDDKIQTNDWYGVNEGKKVKMSSCHIQIDDSESDFALEYDKIDKMSKEYCLPPLPKSLTGLGRKLSRKESVCSQDEVPKEETNLEKKLAVLWREMDSLREQDLTLLSKLWFLNESIQDFRQIIQEQEEVDKLHLLAPSPTPSSLEDEEFVIAASHC